MISKNLLRLGWNWNCQCCQHGIFFVNVWYLSDNPAACITSLFRSKNEWVPFSWGFLRPNNWGESPDILINSCSQVDIWICENLLSNLTQQVILKKITFINIFNFSATVTLIFATLASKLFPSRYLLTRDLFRLIKVTFALYSSPSYLHISYT